jgi:hypothetical protein
MNTIFPKPTRVKLDPEAYTQLCRQVLERVAGGAKTAVGQVTCKFTIFVFAARSEMIPLKT